MDIFYTYLLIDPRNNQPFYVGKGKNGRMKCHEREALTPSKYPHRIHHDLICEILNEGLQLKYEKVLENVSEKEALKEEKRLIKIYGRQINGTGILLNSACGGVHGGSSGKPVIKYTLAGEFVAEYPSIAVASDYNPGATPQYISVVCRGKARSAGGFLWSYKNDENPSYRNLHYRSVILYTHTGEQIKTFYSATEASNEMNVSVSTISSACRGKSTFCNGFLLRYADDSIQQITNIKPSRKNKRKVKQSKLDGTFIQIFETIIKASTVTGIGVTNIYNCCSPKYKNKTAGGFIWEYVD